MSTDVVQFILPGVIGAIVASIVSYRLMRFDYELTEDELLITLHWLGTRRHKSLPWTPSTNVRKLMSMWELMAIPRFPQLWGRLYPSRMVVLEGKFRGWIPLIITPDDPDDFIAKASVKCLAKAHPGHSYAEEFLDDPNEPA